MNKTVKVAKHMNIQKIKKCPHGLRPSQSLGPSSYSSFSPVLVFTSQSAHLQLHSMRKLPPGFPLLVSSVITIHLACFVFYSLILYNSFFSFSFLSFFLFFLFIVP